MMTQFIQAKLSLHWCTWKVAAAQFDPCLEPRLVVQLTRSHSQFCTTSPPRPGSNLSTSTSIADAGLVHAYSSPCSYDKLFK
ncbi:uncharacterized protein EDB91DRAFT_839613 [Suillus paluster]|uniref:uncharacterized protein n=1 Tax=Suillus paluster TaxID=48578 RepID=UPI001B87EC1D|nr:uncharacterized protein EDB91DRAFT_839613 [Suillus paluster]KAG1729102.1 hypothetical protein EDB91DRAFT_839613 [Suillus paluster]